MDSGLSEFQAAFLAALVAWVLWLLWLLFDSNCNDTRSVGMSYVDNARNEKENEDENQSNELCTLMDKELLLACEKSDQFWCLVNSEIVMSYFNMVMMTVFDENCHENDFGTTIFSKSVKDIIFKEKEGSLSFNNWFSCILWKIKICGRATSDDMFIQDKIGMVIPRKVNESNESNDDIMDDKDYTWLLNVYKELDQQNEQLFVAYGIDLQDFGSFYNDGGIKHAHDGCDDYDDVYESYGSDSSAFHIGDTITVQFDIAKGILTFWRNECVHGKSLKIKDFDKMDLKESRLAITIKHNQSCYFVINCQCQ